MSKHQPDGLVWHDDEQPHASYPNLSTLPSEEGKCLDCGHPTNTNFCNRCRDKLIRHGERNKKIYGTFLRW